MSVFMSVYFDHPVNYLCVCMHWHQQLYIYTFKKLFVRNQENFTIVTFLKRILRKRLSFHLYFSDFLFLYCLNLLHIYTYMCVCVYICYIYILFSYTFFFFMEYKYWYKRHISFGKAIKYQDLGKKRCHLVSPVWDVNNLWLNLSQKNS